MKTFKSLFVERHGSNRPATVHAVTEADLTYQFEVAPELSDRRILTLLGHLVDLEERGDQERRKGARK